VSALRQAYDSSLWLLLAITGLVLLIACANLANLMLARASTREREVAVRLALGASRFRLLHQSFVESALLAAVGAALGLGLAQFLSQALVWALSTESGAVHLAIGTDWRVLSFAVFVSGLTCLVFGVAPALRSARTEPVVAINAAGRGLTTSRDRFSLQRLMVVTQIAVSLVLLVGALLFVRSFRNLLTFHPGMRQDGIVIAFVGYDRLRLTPERYDAFRMELLADVRSLPGIVDAGTTTNVPLLGGSWGHGVTIGASEGSSRFTWVDPGYFRTMGIPVLSGRGFDENDTETGPKVAVVNGAFVKRFLGGANPIGRTLRTHPEPRYPATVYQIVGVIADTQYSDLRSEIPPMTFAPASQFPAKGPWSTIMAHTSLPPDGAAAAIKSRIQGAHPGIDVGTVVFQRLIRDGMVGERLLAMLSGFFGLLAAVLATVGLYGVVSYIVARRRNEIGIRVALGASRGQVLRLVMSEAARMLVLGVGIGTGMSLLAGRSASSLLFGLKPHDPTTLAGAAALLALITLGASFVPARRATQLDPMAALRQD
jgi:predicted permease